MRRIVHFGSHGIATHLVLLAAHAAGGVVVAFAASHVDERRPLARVAVSGRQGCTVATAILYADRRASHAPADRIRP